MSQIAYHSFQDQLYNEICIEVTGLLSGRMFPTQGDLHITPFTDESLYMEQFSKANFWYQQSFHGVDLSTLRQAAVTEYFKQPIVVSMEIVFI